MSKPGSGGVSSSQDAAIARRERLRALAVETAEISNDPYFMKNHLGSYECRLCLTLHTNEGSYLAHTQGKKHQQNLARRAAKLANDTTGLTLPSSASSRQRGGGASSAAHQQQKKVGRPAYRVIKQRDPVTGQLSLLFSLHYPLILPLNQPRHRFMSTYEQKQESKNTKIQYLLFAAEPYNVVAFKIPNIEIDRREGAIISHWEGGEKNTFILQIAFMNHKETNTHTIASTTMTTSTSAKKTASESASSSTSTSTDDHNMSVSVSVEDEDWDDYDS